MGKRIILFAAHHPDEPLEVEIEQSSLMELSLSIPNTQVRFKLHRDDPETPFEGSLGGRDFIYDPSKPTFAALFEAGAAVGKPAAARRDDRNGNSGM
jgi:hypothetical protein